MSWGAGVATVAAFVGFVLDPLGTVEGAVGVGIAVALLPVIGHQSGQWRPLAWAFLFPVTAFVADLLLLSGLTQPNETEGQVYSFFALLAAPCLMPLIALGTAVRRRRTRLVRPQAP